MTRSIETVKQIINVNLDMFNGYAKRPNPSQHVLDTVSRFNEALELVNALERGEVEYNDLPYNVRDLFSEMPAWGTRGT